MIAAPAIEIDSLTKQYSGNLAVDKLSLTVETGKVYGFLGPNGAGKTTTIRLLMNTLRADEGVAKVFGLDVAAHRLALRHRIGYVPELHYFHRWMRVHEVIWFCRRLYAAWNDARCKELLKLFELDPKKRVRELSKGMTAKLALLLATAHEPELLILDEPTSGLDPLAREEFIDAVLRTVCIDGRTVLFSSHIMSDVRRLADRIGIIHGGRLLVDSSTDELVTNTKRVVVTVANDVSLKEMPTSTVWHGVNHRQWLFTIHGKIDIAVQQLRTHYPIEHLDVLSLSLEEVFKDFIRGGKSRQCSGH